MSNTSVLDVGVSLTRFIEGNRRPAQTQFKPTDVGLPSYLDQKAGDFHVLPALIVAWHD